MLSVIGVHVLSLIPHQSFQFYGICQPRMCDLHLCSHFKAYSDEMNLLIKICLYDGTWAIHWFAAAGEVLGHLCSANGPEVYRELEPMLISGIKDNLERDQDLITEHPQLMEKLSSRQSPDPSEIERVYNAM